MAKRTQPCCERIALEVTDAPRTEGANPSPDVIRCASCGSTIPLEETSDKRAGTILVGALTQKIGGRRKQPQRKIESKIR